MVEAFRPVGPVALQSFRLEHVCDVNQVHDHPYSHAVLVMEGAADLQLIDLSGIVTVPLRAGDSWEVPAGVRHAVKATAVPLRYVCIKPHRNALGYLVEEYEGPATLYADR